MEVQKETEKGSALSRRAARRDRELELRRLDAIAAASSVFAAKGFDGAQMAEIAAAAEISLASLYALFSGKEELYQEVVLAAGASVRRAVQEAVAAREDPRERLLAVIDSLFSCFEDDGNLLWIHARGPRSLPWKIRQSIGAQSVADFQQWNAWVADRVRDVQRDGGMAGLEADVVAAAILGAVSNTAGQWIESPDGRSLSELAAPVRALFRRVISNEETQ
ncbi:MAG: TetR/AcrR family transcriptional regulator [Myxococcales bacterium]|nr:TetR/AcrR family transcriptional regulator [Myxococcales bacterium]